MLNTETYLPQLKIFEGCIPHMYLDGAEHVTVGVGNMLPNVASAQSLAFQTRSDGRPAFASEIAADFNSVVVQVPGQTAGAYKQFTQLDLLEDEIDRLLWDRVDEFLDQIYAEFPDFDYYPEEVCAALFDMAYNLGMTGLTSEFPKFCEAIERRDWTTAATECHRNGIQVSRNDWTRSQFEQAAGI